MPSGLPDPLCDLLQRLEASGFSVSAEDPSEAFGDREIRLDRGPLAVRLIADRGEWFVELTREEWDDWFDPDIWKACLDQAPVPDEPASLVEQAQFIAVNLSQISDAVRSQGAEDLRHCLDATRAARAKRRLGLES